MIRRLLEKMLGAKYIENDTRLIKINYIIIIFLYVFSAFMLFFLPPDMPMQWDFEGNVNYTLPSIIGIWVIPTILLASNTFSVKQKRVNIISTSVYFILSIVYVYTYIRII